MEGQPKAVNQDVFHSDQGSSSEEELENNSLLDTSLTPAEQLLSASRKGHANAVQNLLQQRAKKEIDLDINSKGKDKFNRGWTALHLAAYFGKTAVVKMLLEAGADVNVVNINGDTPLHKAALTGRMEVLSLLLKHKAEVHIMNDEGHQAFNLSNSQEICNMLEAAQSHDNKRKQEDFISFVRTGSVKDLKGILKSERPPDINAVDHNGNTALHIAAQADQQEAAIFLLQNGANSAKTNIKGQKPVEMTTSVRMKQILSEVRSVQEHRINPIRIEGDILKKARFTGFKPVFVILERGVLSIFGHRDDSSRGTKRKATKYLDGAKILIPESSATEFIMKYSDGTSHTFNAQGMENLSRQKWLDSLLEHIAYNNHYIHQGEEQWQNSEIVPQGSIQQAVKDAQAQQKNLETEVMSICQLLDKWKKDSSPSKSPDQVGEIRKKSESIAKISRECCNSLNHCLALFSQQEEVHSFQLKEEMEKTRVLQESLHALATEHHELEKSIAIGNKAPPGYYDTDDDEFYECDEHEPEDASFVDHPELYLDAMSYNSVPKDIHISQNAVDSGSNNNVSRYGRSQLPVPMFDRNDFSIWSILKQCIGKELSKITMPVVFNEPLSFIQRITEYMEYSDLLEKASLSSDPVERMMYVSTFAISAISSNWERLGKPFNPLLGETYEFDRSSDLGFRFIGEQVSHHPPVTAFCADSPHFKLSGSVYPKLKFWGKSIEIHPKGVLTLELPKHGETLSWSNVNCCVHNVIVGKLWVEHYGVMEIVNHKTNWKAVINFKQAGWGGKELNKVEGFIYDESGQKRKVLYGSWVKDVYAVDVEAYENFMKNIHSPKHPSTPNGSNDHKDHEEHGPVKRLSSYDLNIPTQTCLWSAVPRPENSSRYYSFTLFSMSLNEMTPGLGSKLPPTDARIRPDIRLLEDGNIDLAAEEKNRLEEKQRSARKERKKKKEEWMPRWFVHGNHPVTGKETWSPKRDYWSRDWSTSPDIF